MSFPEEHLDSPVGYFPAEIGKPVKYGEWTIVRKLGYGPRSSTWMAIQNKQKNYAALKIFTVAATADGSAQNEQKILYLIRGLSNTPRIQQHFNEQSVHGEHLCLALNSLTFSLETLRLNNTEEGKYLHLHIVRQILPEILDVMGGLAKRKIIHGAILPDNILFWSIEAAQDIKPELEQSPCHEMVEVIGSDGEPYLTVTSQPMRQGVKWNTTREDISGVSVFLSNFSHGMTEPAPFNAPANFLLPEVLLGEKVDCSVDMWMLGCTAYLLATGTPLFSDSYISSPRDVLKETLPKLEEMLRNNGKVSRKNYVVFAKFLRSCLADDPAKRASVEEQFDNEWIDPYY
ncbi:kinase-like protein [Pholiota conissans]|uniref:non-specific serine/threonine protein kinase n=1 Tax=Pholiota conissans TaxID=109636 RepID=A0A9P5YP85_9AGAR|nr:kinase-like protein [Pholiota conissans]